MLLSEIFKPSNVNIDIQSEDKDELFEEIVNYIVDIEHFDNREEIINTLWIRERKMTTGITPNIAIPHANILNLDRTVGILGISQAGIEYDSLDGNPVHVVMLLLGNANNPTEHLKVLKNIALMLNNPDFYKHLMKCKKPSEVTETIIEFEDILKFGDEK